MHELGDVWWDNMDFGNKLYAGDIKRIGSIELMDEFESKTDGGYTYDTLIFGRLMNLLDEEIEGNPLYDISLYVKRYNQGDKIILSNITFTKLKKEFYDYQLDTLDEYDSSLEEVLQKNIIESFKKNRDLFKESKSNVILFDTQIGFNAQNSTNRMGYGNEYCGSILVHEGTKYGETTLYAFVGMNVTFRE